MASLTRYMLVYDRQYIIEKIKAPLMKVLIVLANKLKIEPTKQNCVHQNTHVLIDIWDKFFEMEDNDSREPLFKAIRKISLAEHEHDPYYRDRMQVLLELWLEEVLKGNWKPRELGAPPSCWRIDPNIRGAAYQFLKDRYKEKQI